MDLQLAIPSAWDGGSQNPVSEAGNPVWALPTTLASAFAFSGEVQNESGSRRATVHFSGASPKEVLKWLEGQGLSFVVQDSQFQSGTTVTLNIVDKPAGEIADALAEALGGHWQRRNGIRVFRTGAAPFVQAWSSGGTTNFGTATAPELPSSFEAKALQQQLGTDFQKKMEARAKDMQKQFGPDFQRKMEAQAKEIQKQFGPAFQQKMEAQARKLEAEAKKKGGEISPDSLLKFQGNIDLLQNQLGPEFQHRIEAQTQDIEKQFGPEFEKRIERMAEDIAKNAEEMSRQIQAQAGKTSNLTNAPSSRTYTYGVGSSKSHGDLPNVIDGKRFLSTLTSGQKDQLQKRGFLLYVDLTPDQRKMLGHFPKGRTVLKFKSDGRAVEIHGS